MNYIGLLVLATKIRSYQCRERGEGVRVLLPCAQRPVQHVLVHQILQQQHLRSEEGSYLRLIDGCITQL